MRTPSRADAVRAIEPNAKFVMVDNVITQWNRGVRPTEEEIDAKLIELIARVHIPTSVTPRQVRLLLLQQGLLQQVTDLIALQDEATRLTWEYALEFRRDDPLLQQIATQLELSEQQIDDFFVAASQL